MNRFFPVVVFFIGLAVTATLYIGAVNNETAKRAEQVARYSELLRSDLVGRVQAYLDTLPGLRALCLLQRAPDDKQFERYLEGISLQQRFPGLAITFIARYVRQQDLATFEREVSEDRSRDPQGHPGFKVHPPGNRAEYMVIRQLDPSDLRTFGYDLYDPAARYREAAEAAVLNDRAVATPPILLARDRFRREQPELTAVVVRLPVYAQGSVPRNETERKKSIWGLAGISFRTKDLVSSVLPKALTNELHIRVVDTAAERDGVPAIIFDSHLLESPNMRRAPATAIRTAPLMVEVAGRHWALTVSDQAPASISWTRSIPLLVLASGLTISLLFTAMTQILVNANKRAAKRVKEATFKLLQNQRNLEKAQELTRVGFYELNIETRLYSASRVIYEILGLDPDMGPVTIPQYLALIHPDDLERVNFNRQLALEGGAPMRLEYRIIRPDGAVRHLYGHGFVTFDEDGKPLRYSGALQDITDRKQAESELANANRSLQMLTRCNETLIRAEDELTLLTDICRIAVDVGGYRLAWVGYAEHDEAKNISPQAHAGVEDGYLKILHLSWDSADDGPASQSIRSGRPAIIPDFSASRATSIRLAAAKARELPGVICLPLSSKNETFGTLALYPQEIRDLSASEIQLLTELADNLAFGIIALRTRAALVEREARFNSLARATSDAIWDHDLVSGVVWRNEGWAKMFNFEAEGVQANSEMWSDQIHPNDRDRVLHSFHAAINGTAEFWSAEYRMLRKDGVILHNADHAVIMRDHTGKAVRMVGGMTDVTERVANEKRIREQAALLDGASDAIFVRDLNHIIRFWNKGAERLYGWTAAEAVGQSALTLKSLDRPGFEAGIKVLLAHGEWVGELSERTKDGTPLLVEARWTLVRDENGYPASILAISSDITERRQAAALRAARDAAELASRSKSEFLARMSHELRTPLNSILGFAQLLQYSPAVQGEDAAQKKLGHILDSGKHLVAMIDDILDLSRIESGALALSPEPVDITQLIADCIEQNIPQAASRNVSLIFAPPDETHVWIRGDRTRVRQVILNLLSNAIKYNRHGGDVELAIECINDDPDNRQVCITIRDTGIGLTAQQRENLFQPFNRLGAEGSGIQGTGIGLVIVRQLLNVMGASIEVSSELGSGSIFTLRFAAAAPGAAGAVAARPVPTTPAAFNFEGRRTVLYVEDNPANVVLVQEALALMPGIRLEIAVDGNAGLAAALAFQPDVILLDINLPGMDGFTVFNKLRAEPALAGIPCVALSANAMSSEIKRARDAGFVDYITKPFDVELLLATLHKLLAAKRRD